MKNPKIVAEWLKKAEDDFEIVARAIQGKRRIIRYPTGMELRLRHAKKSLKAANEIKMFVLERLR